ncbi:MAG: ThuA domain-containing protein [Pirellulales bacterium]
MLRRFIASVLVLLVAGSIAQAQNPKPIKALLVIGGCCHDYNGQKDLIVEGLKQRTYIEIDVAYDSDKSTSHMNPVYEQENWYEGYDVIIHDECSSDVKDLKTIERILAPHKKGVPAVLLHCAMHSYRSEGYPEVTPWFEFSGVQSTGHGPLKPIEISFQKAASPILEGLADWKTINEELYNNSAGKPLSTATVLAKGKQVVPTKEGERTDEAVVVWTNKYKDGTRVFATTLGHANDTVGDARYSELVTRGLLWSCDKLNPTYMKVRK